MASLEELMRERASKRDALRKKGINPYPSESRRTHDIHSVVSNFDTLEKDEKNITIAGRVMSLRKHGGAIFVDLSDGTDILQLVLKADDLGDQFILFDETIDIGDFIDASGTLFRTKTEQETLAIQQWNILTKSLQPLPEKWHGLQDVEARYRKRYLDLLLNPELRKLFEQKTRFWDAIRSYMSNHGFLEVETPTLEITTGGAEARPFSTYHHDFDIDVFLRISVGELWQKRLMAAGFPKTFEIGRVYRNEGSSPEHVQEFTNMECYAAYMNFEEGKKFTQNLYRAIAQEVFGTTKFSTRGYTFDLASEWVDIDYVNAIKEKAGVEVLEADEKELVSKLGELGVEHVGTTRERLIDSLWKYCRKDFSGPAFLINHPKLIAPLSKEHPDDDRLTLTFQVLLAGSEMGRAHAELNDPADQRARFEKQKSLLETGDKEAMMPDWEYVEMLEHGMPPTFGFGFGERLFAFLVDKPIREVQLFPLLRPKE